MSLQFNDLTAWITMVDQVVDVYRIEKPQPNNVTCWIASEAGKKFSVNWRNATREFPLEGTVIIDGLECNKHIILDANSFPDRHNLVGISFARTSDYTQRDFMFAAVQVTADNAYLNTASQGHPFGAIVLEIWRLEVLGVITQPSIYVPNQTLESQTVHQDSMRAGAHHVRYSEEYYSPAPIVDLVSGRRIGDSPYVTFSFKYCPLDILIAHGIVPRPRETKFILDPATEIRQLEAKLCALRARSGSSKAREGGPYPVAGSSRNTKEPKQKRARKTKTDRDPFKLTDTGSTGPADYE